MSKIDQIAKAALDGNSLELRSLCQDILHSYSDLSDCPRPDTQDPTMLACAASLVELLALRANQKPPTWTQLVSGLSQPVYLVKSAMTMKRLRAVCDNESPEPLRRRGFLATPNFLEFV